MILCSQTCIPCCDFCVHAIHEMGDINGKTNVPLCPIGCKLHADKEHQDYARGCYYCEDFHCFEANEEENEVVLEN